MDSNGTFARPFDESLIRELPQLQSLRIAPLRQPVSSRILSIPSPLEPNASVVRDPNSISKANNNNNNNNSAGLHVSRKDTANGGATETSNTGRTKKNNPSVDTLLSYDPPPRPTLPSFVNLRALERFPYSSFDDDSHARKRRRLETQADSFGDHLQLPIPQAQKEQRPPPFGPFAILNGLNEPPPNAALLPPIEAGSITQLLTKPSRDSSFVEPALLTKNSVADTQSGERREGRIEDILDSPIIEKVTDGDQEDLTSCPGSESVGRVENQGSDTKSAQTAQTSAEGDNEPLSPKTRGRSRKNVRKWTEEETTALLRGVVKCGIGNWTAILAQSELKFNQRSASNLKDRFRVCCPWAYRAADPNEATKKLRDTLADALLRAETEGADGTSGKIHLPQPWPATSEPASAAGSPPASTDDIPTSSASSPKDVNLQRPKPRSKRGPSSKDTPTLSSKSKDALASMGLPEAHVDETPRRRSRRPFTTAEDEALLKGYAVHGFQWTLIQQDKRLNLGHRRATDLRDRFRTKFPRAYRDGGSVSGNTLNNENKPSTSKDPLSPGPSKQNAQATKQPPSKPDSAEHNTVGPIDPALSPPAPPQTFLDGTAVAPSSAVFQFPLDENTSTAASGMDTWGDNTLAPMVWDELA
ncbi:hypothetical protein FE257_006876 [Aspergillus nanangensis]|uniref:MYB DNA-binding domain protein n=1 Tax=Aspergillus nanangensis TaxID=2582783 RepID=A0AAD4CNK6_ASPNN|nr:hypothetical protein FE257_006876 [Aspergillus nanangensis]